MVNIPYGKIRDVVNPLIRGAGKPAALVPQGAKTGPSWDPERGAPVEIPVRIVQSGERLFPRGDTPVQIGDRLGLIGSEVAIDLAVSYRIRIDGRLYKLVRFEAVDPGGTTLLYKFHARR